MASVRTRSQGLPDVASPSRVCSEEMLDSDLAGWLKAAGVSEEAIKAIVEVGAESKEDLGYLKEEDLIDCGLKRIQARKVVEIISSLVPSNSSGSCSLSSSGAGSTVFESLPRWVDSERIPQAHVLACETLMSLGTLPEGLWPKIFSATLPHHMQRFVLSLVPNNWEYVKKCSIEAYSDIPSNPYEASEALLNISFRLEDTPRSYADRFEELCAISGHSTADPLILVLFRRGLSDHLVGAYARKKPPTSLQEAIETLKEVLKAEAIDRGGRNPGRKVISPWSSPASRNSTYKTCFYCHKPGHVQAECRKRQRHLSFNQPQSARSNPLQSIRCFSCGGLGHLKHLID